MDVRIFSREVTGKPSSMMKAMDRYERFGAHHRQIVDRAADGQTADVAARKEQRLDYETVGSENLAGQTGGVVHFQEQRVAQKTLEHTPGQLGALAAAAAVGQQDLIHRSPRRCSCLRLIPCTVPTAGRGGRPC